MGGLEGHVGETRPRRDVDFGRFDLLGRFFTQHVLISIETRLALRLPCARRHADPFELALERALAFRLGLFFESQTLLLLLEPGRVLALPRNSIAAIALQNP